MATRIAAGPAVQQRLVSALQSQVATEQGKNAQLKMQSRALGAIVGGFVADAACQPLHWNYDLNALQVSMSLSLLCALLSPDDP